MCVYSTSLTRFTVVTHWSNRKIVHKRLVRCSTRKESETWNISVSAKDSHIVCVKAMAQTKTNAKKWNGSAQSSGYPRDSQNRHHQFAAGPERCHLADKRSCGEPYARRMLLLDRTPNAHCYGARGQVHQRPIISTHTFSPQTATLWALLKGPLSSSVDETPKNAAHSKVVLSTTNGTGEGTHRFVWFWSRWSKVAIRGAKERNPAQLRNASVCPPRESDRVREPFLGSPLELCWFACRDQKTRAHLCILSANMYDNPTSWEFFRQEWLRFPWCPGPLVPPPSIPWACHNLEAAKQHCQQKCTWNVQKFWQVCERRRSAFPRTGGVWIPLLAFWCCSLHSFLNSRLIALHSECSILSPFCLLPGAKREKVHCHQDELPFWSYHHRGVLSSSSVVQTFMRVSFATERSGTRHALFKVVVVVVVFGGVWW